MAEYGLAIAPKEVTKDMQRMVNKSQRLMTGIGRNGCAFTTGLFSDLEPMELRRERLGLRFWTKAESKTEGYAIYFAMTAYRTKGVMNSPFQWMSRNALIRRKGLLMQMREAFDAEREWEVFRETGMQEEMGLFKSAYIFSGKTRTERRAWTKAFNMLERREQRLILNWVLGRSTGGWKTCRHCGAAPAKKRHVELCAYGSNAEPNRETPSKLEEDLKRYSSTDEMRAAAKRLGWILDMQTGP
jgi:hypothetical protein